MYGHCWHKHNLVTHFKVNAKHSKIRSNQVFKCRPLAFTQAHQWKIWSPRQMLGNDVAVFVRVRCNAQFATMSYCARRYILQAFQLQTLMNDTVYRRVMNFCLSWNLTCGSVTLWCTFLTQNQFIEWIIVVISALTERSSASSTPSILPAFLNFLHNLFRPKTAQPLPENSLISFSTIILEFVQILN